MSSSQPRAAAPAATPPPDGAAPHAGDDPSWRRLSPRMLVVHPIQEVIRVVPVLFGLLIAGGGSGHGPLWSLGVMVLAVAYGLARWFTTRYRVAPEQVQVRRGLLRRRVVSVPRDRIRTVDVTSHLLHRLLGLGRVQIGTGRSDRERGGMVRLDALPIADARLLRSELLHRDSIAEGGAQRTPAGQAAPSPALARPAERAPEAHGVWPGASGAPASTGVSGAGGVPATAAGAPAAAHAGSSAGRAATAPLDAPAHAVPGAGEHELACLHPSWIRFAPFTLSGIVAVGIVGGLLGRVVSEAHVDIDRVAVARGVIEHLVRIPLAAAIAEVAAVALVAVVLASTIAYVLSFWGFRLTRHSGGTLHVDRGLLTTRATTLEERRLRGVELSEPLPLRAARGARCIAIATGLRVGHGAERGGSLLLPPAPRAEARRVAAAIVATPAPMTCELRAHGGRARLRRLTRALIPAAAVVAVLAALSALGVLAAAVWLASLALLPAAVLLAADRYRSLGHALAGGHLVARRGSLLRRRCALTCDGIIGWNIGRSFFQRRAGLATLTATTAAGRQRYAVQDISAGEALALAERALPGLLEPFLERE